MSSKFRSLRYTAPIELKNELQDLVKKSDSSKLVFNIHIQNWLSFVAASVAAVVLFYSLSFRHGPSQQELLQNELISSHVHSMMEKHLYDVASTDSHTVKPWFNGRIDFSPQVVDLADLGFPLVGGRLDYIDHRTVAALIYKSNLHVINLFVWPAHENQSDPVFTNSQGYNIWQWHKNGMAFSAISDLNANTLREFVDQYSLTF